MLNTNTFTHNGIRVRYDGDLNNIKREDRVVFALSNVHIAFSVGDMDCNTEEENRFWARSLGAHLGIGSDLYPTYLKALGVFGMCYRTDFDLDATLDEHLASLGLEH